MDLNSARTLKNEIKQRMKPMLEAPAMASAFDISAKRIGLPRTPRSLALGIAFTANRDFQIAVRVQRSHPMVEALIEDIKKQAGGEVDVRTVGRVNKRQIWQQQTQRPLRIGCSIGQFQITAGTLGCFVKSRSGVGGPMILSNNHVLADENRAKIGDAILQPGAFDGGTVPSSVVANLTNFEPLNALRANLVDCATAQIVQGIGSVPGTIDGIGALRGVAGTAPSPQDLVSKTGRTTATTQGRITAIEVDQIAITYETGTFTFDGQIEVEGAGNDEFSSGGDSGSLVVNSDVEAIGLLFAGSETGGSNGRGITYVNPIGAVLDAMNCDIITV